MTFVLSPQAHSEQSAGKFRVDNGETVLAFSGESAELCRQFLERLPLRETAVEIADALGCSRESLGRLIGELKADQLILDESFPPLLDAEAALERIHEAGRFWNAHVMSQTHARRLFEGLAPESYVLGWGIEFFHFVRSARRYMARGASRTDGPTAVMSELWDHFVEEAFHDDIFLAGLRGCGLDGDAVRARVPLPSTQALINHLHECAESSVLSYAAVFAVMQPNRKRPTADEITKKYAFLAEKYHFAADLFEAFRKHDMIDAELDHAELTIGPILRNRGFVSAFEMAELFRVIRQTAEYFVLFFEGVNGFYQSQVDCRYQSVPSVAGLRYCHN
jgi:pyrroloquinoline quinone (PQQ) biosynthesis protein C